MTQSAIVLCHVCKGRGYIKVYHRQSEPYVRYSLCTKCGGDGVLEEITKVTYRRFREGSFIEDLRAKADGK